MIPRNRPLTYLIPKRRYLLAIACYVAIPVVIIAGGALHQLIDPEWARGSADYVRNYRVLDMLGQGVLMAASALALVLWLATCFVVLKANERPVAWLLLAVAGPLGAWAPEKLPRRGSGYGGEVRMRCSRRSPHGDHQSAAIKHRTALDAPAHRWPNRGLHLTPAPIPSGGGVSGSAPDTPGAIRP